MFPMTPWVKRLLVANVLVFFVAQPGSFLFYQMALIPYAALARPWTVFTYMFLHGGLGHLFFNMIGLFFFGPRLENRLGGKAFLWLYFLSGLGGAAFSFLFARPYPVVGASAAVYGVLLGFALFWPRERIYIWGILPVEAWLLAVLLVAGSLWAGVSGAQSGTAHFAHLGGLAFGFAYLRWHLWRQGASLREWRRQASPGGSVRAYAAAVRRAAVNEWKRIPLDELHEINRDEVKRLLAKVDRDGVDSLSQAERDFLWRMAGK